MFSVSLSVSPRLFSLSTSLYSLLISLTHLISLGLFFCWYGFPAINVTYPYPQPLIPSRSRCAMILYDADQPIYVSLVSSWVLSCCDLTKCDLAQRKKLNIQPSVINFF